MIVGIIKFFLLSLKNRVLCKIRKVIEVKKTQESSKWIICKYKQVHLNIVIRLALWLPQTEYE